MLILLLPILLITLSIFSIIFLCLKKYIIGIICCITAIVLNIYCECIPLHLSYFWNNQATTIHDNSQLKILSYNLGLHTTLQKEEELETFTDLLQKQNPDILVLPESRVWNKKELKHVLDTLFEYNTFSEAPGKEIYIETNIYSHYPIKNFSSIEKHYIYEVEIDLPNNSNLKLLACHLSSNQKNSSLTKGEGLIENIRLGYEMRDLETDDICKHIDSWNGPLIICGDLNDISGSTAINKLQDRLKLQDAWWNGGFGYGATFTGKNLYFRLDHILYSDKFELKNVDISKIDLSDHYPLVATFEIR